MGTQKKCAFCGLARDIAAYSPCMFGKTVGAIIEKNGRVLGSGTLYCAPPGSRYGDTIEECPNKNCAGKERDAQCLTMHAEHCAMLSALRGATKFSGATLHLTGHFWPCERCETLLAYFGIVDFCIDPETVVSNPQCRHRPTQKTQ